MGKYKRNHVLVDEADAKSKGGEGTRSVVLSTYRSPDGKITARSQSQKFKKDLKVNMER